MASLLLEALVNQSDIRPKAPHHISCLGAYIGSVDLRNHCWEAKGDIRERFDKHLLSEVRDYLQGFFGSIPREDRITISIYMVGKSPLSASPTVMFISESPSYRKDARKAIKESEIMSRYPAFKTAHSSKDPGFQKIEKLATEQKHKPEKLSDHARLVSFDSSKPIRTFGLPIYVHHSSSIRTATANAVQIGDRFFFQTVYHAFVESPIPSEPSIPDDDDFEIDSETDSEPDNEENMAITSMGSQSPAAWSESESGSESSQRISTISGRSTPVHNVIENIEFDCSLSNTCETLHSFMLARPTYQPKDYLEPSNDSFSPLGRLFYWSLEQDWALVEITDADVTASLKVKYLAEGTQYFPFGNIASSPQVETKILTCTASSGEVFGVLTGLSSYTRLPSSTSFQEVFIVHLNGPLANGDCGSAVVDARTGAIYGHIVAGCQTTGSAYLIAAHQLAVAFGKISANSSAEELSGWSDVWNQIVTWKLPLVQVVSCLPRPPWICTIWAVLKFQSRGDTAAMRSSKRFGLACLPFCCGAVLWSYFQASPWLPNTIRSIISVPILGRSKVSFLLLWFVIHLLTAFAARIFRSSQPVLRTESLFQQKPAYCSKRWRNSDDKPCSKNDGNHSVNFGQACTTHGRSYSDYETPINSSTLSIEKHVSNPQHPTYANFSAEQLCMMDPKFTSAESAVFGQLHRLLKAPLATGLAAKGVLAVLMFLILTLSDGQPVEEWNIKPMRYILICAKASKTVLSYAMVEFIATTRWAELAFSGLTLDWSSFKRSRGRFKALCMLAAVTVLWASIADVLFTEVSLVTERITYENTTITISVLPCANDILPSLLDYGIGIRSNNKCQETYRRDLFPTYYSDQESRNGSIPFTTFNTNKTEAHDDRRLLPHSFFLSWHNYNVRLTLVENSVLLLNFGTRYDSTERIEESEIPMILDDIYHYLLLHSYLDLTDAVDWETTVTDRTALQYAQNWANCGGHMNPSSCSSLNTLGAAHKPAFSILGFSVANHSSELGSAWLTTRYRDVVVQETIRQEVYLSRYGLFFVAELAMILPIICVLIVSLCQRRQQRRAISLSSLKDAYARLALKLMAADGTKANFGAILQTLERLQFDKEEHIILKAR